jgi:NADH-quinone oxidoreductase subunit F
MDIIHRNDQPGGVRISVSAQPGHLEAERCFEILSAWASEKQAEAVRAGSMGYYDLEPVVLIGKPGCPSVFYAGVTGETAERLIRDYLEGGDPRPELALGVSGGEAFRGIPALGTLPLFALQKRAALARCGLVEPEDINDYITSSGGYAGFKKALAMTHAEVVCTLELSGLLKWDGNPVHTALRAFSESGGAGKTLVCRAFDGDIEAHAARVLLEGDPQVVLEGLLIAAYAANAQKAVVAVPEGVGTIRPGLDRAAAQMREHFEIHPESGFECDIEVREVPNALYMREKTALLRCLEGLQAIPALPGGDGALLGGSPALVLDAETLARIAAVLRSGDSTAAGTKILTLTGDVPHAYTVEVPDGTRLGDIVRDIGGASDIKAVQLGGPAGSWYGPDVLDKTVGEAIREAGADLGFSLVRVAAGGRCMAETAAEQARFLRGQSCGKCVFCREGTLHLSQLLDELVRGEGRPDDPGLIEELGNCMRSGCVCAFGRAASNPITSALALFREEFEYRLRQKKCHD